MDRLNDVMQFRDFTGSSLAVTHSNNLSPLMQMHLKSLLASTNSVGSYKESMSVKGNFIG